MNNIFCCSVNYHPTFFLNEPLESRTRLVTDYKSNIYLSLFINLLRSQNYFVKISKNLMAVKNYSKIISLIIFLIAQVQSDLLNIDFKRRKATTFKAAFEPLLVILRKSQSLKRYLSVDNNLTLN